MINPKNFLNFLKEVDITFFTGVPDSLLKDFLLCLDEKIDKKNHIISANEGGAVALAAGYYIGIGNIPLVYMQNSGLGNAVNTLTSLTHSRVYGIPMILLIGWRGEPGRHDEPQHMVQGEVTTSLLDLLNIKYSILPNNNKDAKEIISMARKTSISDQSPYALIVKKNTFSAYGKKIKQTYKEELTRERALNIILAQAEENAIFVSTTGMLSRELFEVRENLKQKHDRDFLTVGSMGHASQIALGISLKQTNKIVYCLDGDGAALMHLGCWSVVGHNAFSNFRHILFNNGVHESVGGQSTSGKVDFQATADSCGYKYELKAQSELELKDSLAKLENHQGPSFLEIQIKPGSRKNLSRPTKTPRESRLDLTNYLWKSI